MKKQLLEVTMPHPPPLRHQYVKHRKSLCQQSQWRSGSVSAPDTLRQLWPLNLTLESDRRPSGESFL